LLVLVTDLNGGRPPRFFDKNVSVDLCVKGWIQSF